jgi:hypothetical protein
MIGTQGTEECFMPFRRTHSRMANGATSHKQAGMRANVRSRRSGPRRSKTQTGQTIFTIGHSIRSIDEFIRILQAHGVDCLIDVRTIPRSRHNPQFNRENLPSSLKSAGIEYMPMPELGGLRRTSPDSVNTGWRNASFRGFADYMQTHEFEQAIERLIEIGREKCVAIMCAEAVPWRCHRSLIGDALLVRGVTAEDITGMTPRHVHTITPFAKVRGTRIIYSEESRQPEPAKKQKEVSRAAR